MNINEAMQAAINGDRVSWPGLGRDTFVEYDFNGFEKKCVKKFGEWASCTFIASEADNEAEWSISDYQPRQLPAPKADVWGTGAALAASITETGKSEVRKLATGLAGFLAAQAAPEPSDDAGCTDAVAQPWAVEPKRDVWGRPID